MKGTVTALDIGDLKKPVKVWQLALTVNPGLVRENLDMVIISDRHGGWSCLKGAMEHLIMAIWQFPVEGEQFKPEKSLKTKI